MGVQPSQRWYSKSIMVRNWRHWPEHLKAKYQHNIRIRRLHFTSALPNSHTHLDPSQCSYYCCLLVYPDLSVNKKENDTRGVISYLSGNGRVLTRCRPRLRSQSAWTGATSLHLVIYVWRQNKRSAVTCLTTLSLSLSLTRIRTQARLFPRLCDSVDTVNNWRWHSKVNVAPPRSHFSAFLRRRSNLTGSASQPWLILSCPPPPPPLAGCLGCIYTCCLLPWRLAFTLG